MSQKYRHSRFVSDFYNNLATIAVSITEDYPRYAFPTINRKSWLYEKYPFDQKSLWNEWQTFIYADQPLQDIQGGGVGGHHQAEPLQVEDEDVLCHLDIQLDSS